MNSRVRTGLFIAIGGFLLIAVGIFLSIRFLNVNLTAGINPPTPTPVAENKVLVAFAAKDVVQGAVLTAQDIKLTEMPMQYVASDAITNLDEAVGRISKTDLSSGEMILAHNLVNPTGVSYDVAYILDDKHVLMALPAEDLMSREAIIKRGDIVDIMVSIQERIEPVAAADQPQPTQSKTPQQVTFTASQKLGITAIVIDVVNNQNQNGQPAETGTAAEGDAVGPRRDQIRVQAYLIALDPQEALVLKFLKDKGALFDFVIRAPTSTAKFELTPVTADFIKELYGLDLLP